MFELRGNISYNKKVLISFLGLIFFLFVWYMLPTSGLISPLILPDPLSVLLSIKQMYLNNDLLFHLFYSIKLNIFGYLEAIVISLILGFIIGLFPECRAFFEKYIAAMRFLPLSAMTGIFIAFFGISTLMKVQFLAFGIIVYMLPVVIQRIDEVDQVYVDTVTTLGANKLQTIKNVFIPDVLSRFFDDIRVLTAISWTYIIIAELVNKTSGLGALIYTAARQSSIESVYAILLIIVAIGFIQDKVFKLLDRLCFRFKYVQEKR